MVLAISGFGYLIIALGILLIVAGGVFLAYRMSTRDPERGRDAGGSGTHL